jgi:hypothetical protein
VMLASTEETVLIKLVKKSSFAVCECHTTFATDWILHTLPPCKGPEGEESNAASIKDQCNS